LQDRLDLRVSVVEGEESVVVVDAGKSSQEPKLQA
jgi:hypothetical protein